MPLLHLTFLGGFEVRPGAGPAVQLPRKKAQALLAYLVVEPGAAHLRDKLASLLWGDSSDQRARQSLRQTLLALKQALPKNGTDILRIDAETVALNRQALEVDVAAFEQLADEGTPQALARAAALYKGEFLEGLGAQGQRFEEWLITERERLREVAVEILGKLLAHHIESGAAQQAIRTAGRLLVLDPLQEVVHRALMRLYAQLGRRDAALRQYQICSAVLQRELGIEPETPTQQLHRELLQARHAAAPASPAQAASKIDPNDGAVASPTQETLLATIARQIPSGFVGRQWELARLRGWLDQALRGERRIVFVTGEPGMGKTTMVDAFCAADVNERFWVARGQCAEHYGRGEAYLPVLEALGRLCQEPGGAPLIERLGRYAPTWLLQLPGVVDDAELDALQRRALGTTPERMVRELAEAIEGLPGERGLLLWLEDLQWSDDSTLDLISYLGQRRGRARFMLIATYRPVDVMAGGHPVMPLMQELRAHAQCVELPLHLLTAAEVGQHLEKRFTRQRFPAELARIVHRTTEGNPLFMVSVVNDLVAAGVIKEVAGRWQLDGRVEDIAVAVPESVWHLVEKQLDRLATEEQQLLQAASVAGEEFSPAAVAAAVGADLAAVEEMCDSLVRCHLFLEVLGGTSQAGTDQERCYRFLHSLYRHVINARASAVRRCQWHQRIGEWKENTYVERVREIAVELAMHFERGGDPERAVRHLAQAAQTALQRSAHREAIVHLTHAQDLLGGLPSTPERALQELMLHMSLTGPLVMTKGYSAPEVERTFARALELCRQLGQTAQLFPLQWGLWLYYLVRGELHTVRALGEEGLALTQQPEARTLRPLVHNALGIALFFSGDFISARTHLDQAVALDDPQSNAFDRSYVDPGLGGLLYGAHTLWYLGFPDQALRRSREALDLAQQRSYLHSQAFALNLAATVHAFRGEADAAGERARTAVQLCHDQGFMLWWAHAMVLRGWARATQARLCGTRAQAEEGIAEIRQGLNAWDAIGAELARPFFLTVLAEVYARAERAEEALAALAEASTVINRTGERMAEAELCRLQGTLTLQGNAQGRPSKVTDAAEEWFLRAIDIARRQEAKSLELRAAISLSRLWQRLGMQRRAYELLEQIYGWFTEGFETADLRAAAALLDALRGTHR
jgi:DNA-binding SARP family transcriptional activator/predicted ATPase